MFISSVMYWNIVFLILSVTTNGYLWVPRTFAQSRIVFVLFNLETRCPSVFSRYIDFIRNVSQKWRRSVCIAYVFSFLNIWTAIADENPDQVHNADKTSLFLLHISSKIYITTEEVETSGFSIQKNKYSYWLFKYYEYL